MPYEKNQEDLSQAKRDFLRNIPAVEKILSSRRAQTIVKSYPRSVVVAATREVLDKLRDLIITSEEDLSPESIQMENIVAALKKNLEAAQRCSLRKVVNATGIIVHTNLGRSILPRRAFEQLEEVALNYSNLEMDLQTGKRGSRYSHVAGLLQKLTGAEAALVMNNNAAAVLLVLDTLAKGKEVIVSRGQLVEIGGSFRIPDIMGRTGAVLVEVGTTNRTHFADYERAITQNTAFLMKVHTSNYSIVGFTSEVSLDDLVVLGRKYGLPVVEDLGSGSFVDFSRFGLLKEPTVQEALAAGADIVTFSGDKLLGGPQAGIILGKASLLDSIRCNPLNRAVRIDKLTLAALEATLKIYLEESQTTNIPTLRFLQMSLHEINRKALRLYRALKKIGEGLFICEIIKVDSQVGGGALPLQRLESRAVCIKPHRVSIVEFEAQMRNASIPVIGRIEQDRYLMDMRMVGDKDISYIAETFRAIFL